MTDAPAPILEAIHGEPQPKPRRARRFFRIPDDLRQRIVCESHAGRSNRAIAKLCDVAESTVRSVLRADRAATPAAPSACRTCRTLSTAVDNEGDCLRCKLRRTDSD
jgi:transposase-like protein